MAGPLVLFSLNSSAGPTRQSHTFVSSSSRNRRPCTTARTPPPRPCSPLQAAAAATPLRRLPRTLTQPRAAAPAPLLRSRSRRPVPRLRRLQAAAAATPLRRLPRTLTPLRAAAPAPLLRSNARAALFRACAACKSPTARRRHPRPAPPALLLLLLHSFPLHKLTSQI